MVKKFRLILVFAGALLCACAQTLDTVGESDLELCLDPVPVPLTKAYVFPRETHLGVSVWEYHTGAWQSGTLAVDGVEFAVKGSAGEGAEGGYWRAQEPVFWPAGSAHVGILAYAPYGTAARVNAHEGVVWEHVNARASGLDNLLYSEPRTDLSLGVNGQLVILPMKNAAAMVGFSFKSKLPEGAHVSVTKIQLTKVGCSGSFRSLPEPEWALDAAPEDVVFFEGSEVLQRDYTPVGSPIPVIPQLLEGTVTVTLDDGFSPWTLSKKLPATLIEGGRHVSITASILDDDIAFMTEIIEHIDDAQEGGE